MNRSDQLAQVLKHLKSLFVGKNDVIDLLGICLLSRENAFILGPPGSAKSAIIRALSDCISDGNNFEYLLTRFTEPNEIFGPFDIRKLKEGELITNTEGMMPEASLVFLDEIFNANSAILNSLLMALNEKIFKRGKEKKQLPALMFVGASNSLPEDETLNALLDRFLVRVVSDYVEVDLLEEVLIAGWNMQSDAKKEIPTISSSAIKELQALCKQVNLSEIRKEYIQLIQNIRATGVKVSDRRAVKIQNLIAASAVMCNRDKAVLSDLWVMKYIWDTEEQIELLAGIVDEMIDKGSKEGAHPQAFFNKVPSAEELMKEINLLKNSWHEGNLTFEEQNVVKDKLRYIQSRSGWIHHADNKQYVQSEIDSLWQIILKTV